MGKLQGKVALITGAARGQGEAEARLFVEEGAQVVLGDMRDDLGKQVAESIGSSAIYLNLDVSREESWAGFGAGALEGPVGDADPVRVAQAIVARDVRSDEVAQNPVAGRGRSLDNNAAPEGRTQPRVV